MQCRWRTVFTLLKTVTMRSLEVNALLAEIDKIANNTRFNDVQVLDGSYDQTIRAGNTNAETIRVSVGSLKTADNAKIEHMQLKRACSVSDSVLDRQTLISSDMVRRLTVEIDTSVFSTTFKEAFKS